MKKASLAVACVLALIVTVFAQSTGQRRVGWANTVTELLSLTPSKEAYVYVTKGNLYATNLDGKILAYDPSSTATVNNTNVWAPDSGIGRWLLISTLNGSGGGGGGAITLTVPDGFGVTGSPLTPPGTLTITTTLTNLAKGTGSGFSNAVASVDYVPPGPIGSSGLTMTGTNLLGRYSSGTGAIQTISVSNGLSFYASQLLGPLNPTDGYLPYRVTGSDSFGDSPWYVSQVTNAAINTDIVFGLGTTNFLRRSVDDLYYQSGAANPKLIIRGNGGSTLMQVGLFGATSAVLESPSGAAVLRSGSYNLLFAGTGGFYPNDDDLIDLGGLSTTSRFRDLTLSRDAYVYGFMDGTNYSRLKISHSGTNGSVILDSTSLGTAGAARSFAFQSNGVTIATISSASGYTGTGTNFLSDDGTYKAVSGSGGTTINPTDGYLPYRTSSTTFGDSPWYRVDTNRLGFNTTNIWLSSLGTNVFIGDSVGNSTLSGTLNIVIGDVTANNITSGQKNIVIGNNAGAGITTSSESVVIGPSANSTASYNVVVGSQAKGGSNGGTTAIGTLANAIAGASGNNVAVGYGALQSGTTASTTVAIGRGALISLQDKDQAVVIGDQAAYNVTDATMGVAIGYQAGVDATNIVQSVIIGGRPLRVNSRTARTVMDSVIIGHKPDVYTNDVASITNSIYIGSGLLPATNNVAQIGTNGVFVLYLNGDVGWFRGTGAPTSHASGLVTNAPVGSMYSRLDGGMNSSFYVVETSSGNWVAK